MSQSILNSRCRVGIAAFTVALLHRAPALAQAPASVAEAAPTPTAAAPTEDSAQGGAGQLQEIVVTARSRGETLINVPVAVTALSAKEINRYSSSDLILAAQTTPSVEIYTGGSRAGAAFIVRGVGTTADTAGVDPSVSVSFDGTQAIRSRIVTAGLFDVQQLEMMAGPQALFFGKNASAGVIAIKTGDPGKTLGGYVDAGYEFDAQERYVEGAISIPITDTLRVRVAGRYDKLLGWVHNNAVAIPDPNNPSVTLPAPFHTWGPGSETLGGRLTLVWEPNDDYSVKLKAGTGSYKDAGPTSTVELICDGPHPITLGRPAPLNDCALNGQNAINDLPSLYTNSPFGDPR